MWRRCEHCDEPLRAAARSDARYCSPACKQAARRWRARRNEAVEIGLNLIWGVPTDLVVRCPTCGQRFALGHGHRRDAHYCGHTCRQVAYRARQRAREAVTP